jgi:SET domain
VLLLLYILVWTSTTQPLRQQQQLLMAESVTTITAECAAATTTTMTDDDADAHQTCTTATSPPPPPPPLVLLPTAAGERQQQPTCGLYLAPSTIPGAGLGVFTTFEKQMGDTIQNFGDVCIPIVDLFWHSPMNYPFTDYYWSGYTLGLHEESNKNGIDVICPGLDCAVNCHLALDNVEKAVPQYDDGSVTMGYHRNTHAGVGAFTPYYNGLSYAKRYIPAGGEIFKHYGDEWFISRQDIFGNIPLTDDYTAINVLIRRFLSLRTIQNIMDRRNHIQDHHHHHHHHWTTTTTTVAAAVVEVTMVQELYETVIRSMQRTYDSRTLNALPETLQDTFLAYHSQDIRTILQPRHVHTIEYLQQYGSCMDHIRPGPSTVPNAGRGAFAVRNLPKGTVITISPILHTPNEDYMYMYNFTKYNHTWFRLKEEVRQMQLLYNYCYAHPESTLLFCPYGGGMSYINHNRTQANVRIEWAKNFDMVHNPKLVETGTIAELTSSPKPQLAFQYIATQDIAMNEELFMDYGNEWEDAWLHHVQQYPYQNDPEPHTSTTTTSKYVAAHYWNYHFGDLHVRTTIEQRMDPYPTNLQIRCHGQVFLSPAISHAIYRWNDENYGLPCRILDRFLTSSSEEEDGLLHATSKDLYTVEIEYLDPESVATEDYDENDITTLPNDDDDDDDGPVVWVQRTDVPRSAIRFFDLPYTTDLHLTTAFRHYVGIPNDLFPTQWRNL